MKNSLILCLLLTGCRTAQPVLNPLPESTPLQREVKAYAVATPGPLETASADRRLMAALVEENQVLTEKLQSVEEHPAKAETPKMQVLQAMAASVASALPVSPVAVQTPAPKPETKAPADPDDPTVLVPNAEGLIDVTALDAPPPGAPSNPFALRGAVAGERKETTFSVQAIVMGPAPCALVNDHVVEPGERVASFKLTEINAESIVLSGGDYCIKLSLGETRVKLGS